jgi:hypothetical protein
LNFTKSNKKLSNSKKSSLILSNISEYQKYVENNLKGKLSVKLCFNKKSGKRMILERKSNPKSKGANSSLAKSDTRVLWGEAMFGEIL